MDVCVTNTTFTYRTVDSCHQDLGVVSSHRIRNIKIRYIIYLVTLSREIL